MLKFIYKAKRKELITLIKHKSSIEKIKVLDEIIDNAMELPLESQNLLLILAKGMAYTRNCVTKQFNEGQINKVVK